MSFVDHHAGVATIASMTVVVVADMAVAATMIIIVHPDTMSVSVALMDDVMTMALAASIAMHQDVTIVIAAAMTIVAVAMTTMVVTVDAPVAVRTANQHLQEIVGIRTVEVEPSTTVMMIGTPVDSLRSANLLRCGALCQIMRPSLSAAHELQISGISV